MKTYKHQIDELAKFILNNMPEEIGKGNQACGESAVEVAIRLLFEMKSFGINRMRKLNPFT